MKHFFLLLFISLTTLVNAQNTNDTTIYQVTDRMASFEGCDYEWYSEKQQDSCRMVNLMRFMSNNLRYPQEAKEKNVSGRVVVKFVVEKDGSVSNATVLKDIGSGCGAEALRIINGINEVKIKWHPGLIKGKTVRSFFVLPVVFKLQEDPGYSVVDGYPVYYTVDKPLRFKDTTLVLNDVLKKNLKNPAIINDSCRTGVIQTEILVLPNGTAKALQIDDFCGLGIDAQFEVIQAITATNGLWQPAEYKGKNVPTSVTARIIFKSDAPKCKASVTNFEKAYSVMQVGVDASNTKDDASALTKLNEAVDLMPQNMEFLYLRGIMHMNLNKRAEACLDLTKVKTTLNVNWVDSLLPLLCK
jgi:TonB family protein